MIKFTLWPVFLAFLALGCEDPGSVGESDNFYVQAEVNPEFNYGKEAVVQIVKNATLFSGGSIMGDWMTNGTVKLNSTQLSVDITDSFSIGSIPFSGGDTITLDISSPDVTLSKSLIMPDAPAIQTPSGGYLDYDFSGTDDILIKWSSLSPEPDEIIVFISGLDTVNSEDYSLRLTGDATSCTISSGIIKKPMGSSDIIEIRPANKTSLSGENLHSSSYYKVMSCTKVYVYPDTP